MIITKNNRHIYNRNTEFWTKKENKKDKENKQKKVNNVAKRL